MEKMSAASNANCPVCRTAEVVCGKWTLLIVPDLAEGNARFCELERSPEGISPRTLSRRLRALEEEVIVARHTYPEVPPRVEYALTVKGEALVPLIEDLRRYGTRWLRPALAPRTQRAAARRPHPPLSRRRQGGSLCRPGSPRCRRSAPRPLGVLRRGRRPSRSPGWP